MLLKRIFYSLKQFLKSGGRPLNSSIFQESEFNKKESAWIEHIPFAFFLTQLLKPKTFVELGTHNGTSYFSFCQAIQKNYLTCNAFAVDHWEGDEHAGYYDDSTFEYVSKVNQENFSDFSILLKLSFDEALKKFEDGSIDLLHIDGMHTYEAVKHDFQSWLPKLSDRSVVLLHDTRVRERDFGVWKFFEELQNQYLTFEFTHGYGLGIVCTGKNINPQLKKFIKKHRNDTYTQQLFTSLGRKALYEYMIHRIKEEGGTFFGEKAQLFIPDSSSHFSEGDSVEVFIFKNQSKITFDLENETKVQRLRFDPFNDYVKIRLDSVLFFNNGTMIEVFPSISSNASEVNGNEYFFYTKEPQLYFDFPDNGGVNVDRVTIGIKYLKKGREIIPDLIDTLQNR